MGLVYVVVRVLAEDDGFDGVQGGVAGPGGRRCIVSIRRASGRVGG